MFRKSRAIFLAFAFLAAPSLVSLLYAQSDRGTITGTVTDAGGAVIPNADVIASSDSTQTLFRARTTDTGNYTIPSVPSGTYTVKVQFQGFKTTQSSNVEVGVAQTVRVDFQLEIGSATESVEVTAETSLLKTESAEQSTIISNEQLNQLPLNFAGGNAIRNPLTFAELSPGSTVGGWNEIHINGSPGSMYRIIFEGQDTTSALQPRVSDESQPSIDAIQEFAIQTSNFSAEFGQVTGGLFNFTARSGTNQFHGSAYEYFANEALNAGNPYTSDGSGHLVRPVNRQNDFGGNLGGPLWIPKVYNGHNKTFFFFNYEMYRHNQGQNNLTTVPTNAYRNGDFSYLLTGRQLGVDPLGRPIMEGAIYDPKTERTVGGQIVRDPFLGNLIPTSRFDPAAVKIQNLIPAPLNGGAVNNFASQYLTSKIQYIPSIKIDHNIGSNDRLAGYFSYQSTNKDNGQDGLPDPISARRFQTIYSNTTRISWDHIFSPIVVNHAGIGYQRYHNPDTTPITDFNSVSQLGLPGAIVGGFPRFEGLNVNGSAFNLGPTNYQLYLQDKPTVVDAVTWTHNNHTLKFGGEWRFDNFSNIQNNGATGYYNFDPQQTGLPSTQGQSLNGGAVGNSYASFLLGATNRTSISNPAAVQYRRYAWAVFAQDTWKVNRKLTLDIGLRYDLQEPQHELNNRRASFEPNVPNPNAGGLNGAIAYEGDGSGRCNCNFASFYKLAFGPRLGAAYQINEKTVFRAGWGVTYGSIPTFNYIGAGDALGYGFNTLNFTSPGYGQAASQLANGISYSNAALYAVSFDPGARVHSGSLESPPAQVDRNGGRPPRISQWSFNLQRQLAKDFMVEAAYVGNRGAWLQSNGLVDYNALTVDRIRAAGLDVNSATDRALLTSTISSPQAIARGFRKPYANFPDTQTVAQSLRPFPQFGGIGATQAPLGNNWYDSLQVKLNKRFSRGLSMGAAYTFSKTLTTVADEWGDSTPTNDVFNRRNQKTIAPIDQPHILVVNFHYEVPRFSFSYSVVNQVLSGWEIGGILRYASGLPIASPNAQNALGDILFRGTLANRVPGQPLYLTDINCGCIDPNKTLVLNPNAWTNPAPGQWGTAAPYYSDYRYQRRPDEQISVGRLFRLTERFNFEVRAEFFNVLNRAGLGNPQGTDNAFQTTHTDSNGNITSAFGRINPSDAPGTYAARSGQIVARFRF